MSRKRQAKKRKKRKPVKKQSYAVSGNLFREASGILMEWVMDKINEMSNERLCTVRNRCGSGAELARETLISRDPGLAIELTDGTIRDAVKSYFKGDQTYGKIECWDVSRVTNMNAMFEGRHRLNSFEGRHEFNSDLSGWDVSNVRVMTHMFWECHEFNSDLSRWDVSNVTDMYCMFYLCHGFNSDLSGWNVSNVVSKRWMFYRCNKMIATNKPN